MPMSTTNSIQRKRSFLKLSMAFILASLIQATIASAQNCIPAPAGLVSWWRGEGNADDFVGTNNAMIYGGVTFTNGEVEKAFLLNGTDGYIEVPNAPALNPRDAITVEAWYSPISFAGNGNNAIVDKGYTSHSSPYYQYHLGVTGDQLGYATFQFSVAAGGNFLEATTPRNAWIPGNCRRPQRRTKMWRILIDRLSPPDDIGSKG